MKNIQFISVGLLALTIFSACGTGQPTISKEQAAANSAILQKEYEELISTWSPKNWPPLPKNYQTIVEKMLVPKGRDPRDFPAIWQEEPIKELVVFVPSTYRKGRFQPVRSPKVGTKPYWFTCVESGSPQTTTYEFQGNGRAPGGGYSEKSIWYGTVCVAWQNGKPYAYGARTDKGNSTRTPLYNGNWSFVNPDNYMDYDLTYAPDGAWPAKPAAPADK